MDSEWSQPVKKPQGKLTMINIFSPKGSKWQKKNLSVQTSKLFSSKSPSSIHYLFDRTQHIIACDIVNNLMHKPERKIIAYLFTRRQILDSSKWKEFADDNFKIVENGRKLSKRVENTVGKGEIACYKQFLLFPQCFQKACFPGASKDVTLWEWVNPLPNNAAFLSTKDI